MFRIANWSQLTVVDSRRQLDVVVSPSHVCTTQLNSTQLIPTASWDELSWVESRRQTCIRLNTACWGTKAIYDMPWDQLCWWTGQYKHALHDFTHWQLQREFTQREQRTKIQISWETVFCWRRIAIIIIFVNLADEYSVQQNSQDSPHCRTKNR